MIIIRNYLSRFGVITLILCQSLAAVAQVQKSDSLSHVILPEVEVSALRLPFRESNVPYGISYMIARTNTQGLSLAESVAGIPGLQVNARYNYAVGDRITNRGFGARTQFGVRGIRIIVDDIPLTFADGQSNLEMIDMQNLSSVELLRGPGSSLYGNASGGVLLLRTKPVSDNRFLTSIGTTYGSDGLFRWTGLLEGRSGNSEITGSYSHFRYSGYRDHANAEYSRAFIKMGTRLNLKDNLLLEGGVVKFNSLNPGALTKKETDENPAQANPSSIANAAGQDGSQEQLGVALSHKADTSSQLKFTLYVIHRSVINPIIGKIVVLPQYSGGASAIYSSVVDLGKIPARWSAGLEISTRFNKRKNFTNVNGTEGELIIHQNEQVIGTGFFIQTELPLITKLNMDVCLRYDLDYFGVENKLDTASQNSNGHKIMKALDPSLGLIYRINKHVQMYGNISTSFETPTTTELVNRPDGAGGFNPDLNPSHAVEYELGFRGIFEPLFVLDATGYMINTNNELIPFEVPSSPGQVFYRNAGSTVHQGLEFTIRFVPTSFLDVNTSFTFINASYKTFVVTGVNYSGNKIPGINRAHVVAEIKVHDRTGLFLSFLIQNFGRMSTDDANTSVAQGYWTFDLGGGDEGISFGNKLRKKLSISGGISNIMNRGYITAVSVNAAANRYFEPGPGRTFYLNLRFDFSAK